MPQDLYRWEQGNALVHHCPQCQTPLTHARCRTKCLGSHVEWCKSYHSQLFKKGASALCMACISSSEQHEKRHRNIAELIRQLRKLQEQKEAAPKPINGRVFVMPTDCAMSKKERKAQKKAVRALDRPKPTGAAEIKLVDQALHPVNDLECEEAEREHLLNDPDIVSNLPFHRGIDHDRELRKELIANDRHDGKFEVDDEELLRITHALQIPHPAKNAAPDERKLYKHIVAAIKDDLTLVRREDQETMKRKAGFWRWASRKAYNKLVQNGSIWEWKSGHSLAAVGEEEGEDEDEDEHATLEHEAIFGIEDQETDSYGPGSLPPINSSRGRSVSDTPTLSTSITTISETSTDVRPELQSGDTSKTSEWTRVGHASTLKLSANGGLEHLMTLSKASQNGSNTV